MPGRAGLGRLGDGRARPAPRRRSRPTGCGRASAQTEKQSASAGAQHAPVSAQRRRGVGHQHVAEAAHDAVDRVVGRVHLLGVDHAELDVARGPSSSARRRAASTISDEKSVVISLPSSPIRARREAGLAGAGGELEDRLAGLRVEHRDQSLADGPGMSHIHSRPRSQPAAICSQVSWLCGGIRRGPSARDA